MPKLYIYSDELYPYYGWDENDLNFDEEFLQEVTPEFYEELKKVTDAFFTMQQKLKELKEGRK